MGVSWAMLAPFIALWSFMGRFWWVLAPFIALAITIAFMQLGVFLTGIIRGRDYRRFEDESKERLARLFRLPMIDESIAEERRRSLSPFLDKAHQAASRAQTKYHNAVVRSAGCLVLRVGPA